MIHPLFSLLETRPEVRFEPAFLAEKSGPESRPVSTPQPPGGQVAGGGDVGGGGSGDGPGAGLGPSVAAVASPGPASVARPPRPGFEVAPGFAILAVQAPPLADGRPGEIIFGSGLTLADQRRIASGFAWWDRADKRRERRDW